MSISKKNQAFRSSILDFLDDPFLQNEDVDLSKVIRYFQDGLLVVDDAGKILELGHFSELWPKYEGPDCTLTDYLAAGDNYLLVPGLIDTHIHYPQTEMIAAYGTQLMEWLHKYTFPVERQFSDPAYASRIASFFLDSLLQHGTTTALVMAAVFPASVDAFFEHAASRRMRMIAGKVMMDREAPDYLLDTAESSYLETQRLIANWHKRDRLLYAVTPRFAITSTPRQLELAGQLLREHPDVYLHTHISENLNEISFTRSLFPDDAGYLDTYDKRGLVTNRSVFAHGVHLTDAEFQRLHQADAGIAFCPTSNTFLGSGLFDLAKAKCRHQPVKVGLGTDVGGGTSFSILTTAHEAYKVGQLKGQSVSALRLLFLATLGGARTLNLQHCIGNFNVGNEADFVVLDLTPTPILKLRGSKLSRASLDQVSDLLFGLLTLSPDNAIVATHILGNPLYQRGDQKR